MVANEVFIDSATLRENVVSLARNIGYLPRSRKAAAATISFFIDTSNITPTPSTITLKKGPVATSSGSFGNQSFVYSILELTYRLTDPILYRIRRFLPNLGSLDISPIILLLLIWFIEMCMKLYIAPMIF